MTCAVETQTDIQKKEIEEMWKVIKFINWKRIGNFNLYLNFFKKYIKCKIFFFSFFGILRFGFNPQNNGTRAHHTIVFFPLLRECEDIIRDMGGISFPLRNHTMMNGLNNILFLGLFFVLQTWIIFFCRAGSYSINYPKWEKIILTGNFPMIFAILKKKYGKTQNDVTELAY